jgi:hypothetical protein
MHSSRSQALHHSLKLRGHAAEMRGRHNAAEVALWRQLCAGQQGVWFRRQVVLLGSCIVDFYCPAPGSSWKWTALTTLSLLEAAPMRGVIAGSSRQGTASSAFPPSWCSLTARRRFGS